jgi:RND superfamily putative drug exporter
MSKASAIIRLPAGRRTKWAVVVFWLIIVAVLGPLAGKLTGAEKNDASAWLPAAAESTKVLDVQSRFQSPNIYAAVVVYDRGSGLTGGDKAKAAEDVRRFARVHGVVRSQLAGPIPSADGKAMETIVPINLGSKGWNGASAAATKLRVIARTDANGLAFHIAGPLGNAADSASAFKGIDGTLLYATLAVVIVLLLITYRSPVLWLLPVMSAGVALAAAQGLIYLLARHGLTVNAQSAGILLVLVFGAGTDYALLLTARYREELRRHQDRHEAMAVALRRAGPAIIASAGTVIVSLLTLTIAELASTKSLGPVLAIGVVVALAAMMTLLPALLVIFGRWVFWPVKPAYGTGEPTTRGFWARVGRRIAIRPRLVWVITAVILGAMALGLTGLKASGLTTAQGFRHTPDSVVGQTVIDQHFPAGAGQPVIVIGNQAHAAALLAAVKATPGITGVTGTSKAGHAYLTGTLTTAPDSQAAYNTIDRIRTAVHAVPGANALVGGNTAINLDVKNASAHDRTVIIPVILAVVFLILALLLRALIAPIMLTATVVLSFAAGRQRAGVQPRLRLRRRRHLVPAVRLRVPGRPGHRLQHLPHDPGARGGGQVRPAARRAHRPGGDRRGDHLGRRRTGRHLRRAGDAACHVPGRAGLRRGVRRAARHDHRQVSPGHRPQPRPRPLGLVAQQTRPRASPRSGHQRRAGSCERMSVSLPYGLPFTRRPLSLRLCGGADVLFGGTGAQ